MHGQNIRTLAARSTRVIALCRKCGKKLGGGFGTGGKLSLAKALRRELDLPKGKRARVRLVETTCLDLCPKGAVVVIDGARPFETLLVHGGTPVAAVAARLALTEPPATEPVKPTQPLEGTSHGQDRQG